MIRINLLPVKQDRRREAARNQIIIAALVISVEIVFFVLLYMRASAQVDEQRNKNQMVQNQVDLLEKQVKDHNKILNEIAEFEKRQAAIEELQAARTGPVYVMLELSNLMSQGGRPYFDHDDYIEKIRLNPELAYDENWDFRRVWISSFNENNRKVKISGAALTHEDVAEFLRRINLSHFFVSSALVNTALSKPSLKIPGRRATSEPVVKFSMSGLVKYR